MTGVLVPTEPDSSPNRRPSLRVFAASAVELAIVSLLFLLFFFQLDKAALAASTAAPIALMAFGYLSYAVYYRRVLTSLYRKQVLPLSNPFQSQGILGAITTSASISVDWFLMLVLLAMFLSGAWFEAWMPIANLLVVLAGSLINDWAYEIRRAPDVSATAFRHRLLLLWAILALASGSRWMLPWIQPALGSSETPSVVFTGFVVAYALPLSIFMLIWREHAKLAPSLQ